MPNNVKKKSTALDLKALKKLFGPAPVLTSESLKEYDLILKLVMDCIEPGDFILQMFVKDYADASWDIKRFGLHKTLLIERENQRHQEMEAKRRQKEQEKKAAAAEWDAKRAAAQVKTEEVEQTGETNEVEQADQAGAPTTQLDRMLELEKVIDSTVDEVDDIYLVPADEIDHAKALESGIDYFEQLDHLLGVAMARRNNALAQIEFYRQGLGQRLRRVSDEIIDGQFSETHQAAPSIAGPDDGAQ